MQTDLITVFISSLVNMHRCLSGKNILLVSLDRPTLPPILGSVASDISKINIYPHEKIVFLFRIYKTQK